MVELKEFVAESLKQIIDGVQTAQAYAEQKNATVNPSGLYETQGHYEVNNEEPNSNFPIAQFIEFDVAVTVTEGKEAKAGIGIFAAAIGAGTQAKVEDANMMLSRIKFSVPILLPLQTPH